MVSIAAAGPDNGLFVSLQTGHLAKSVGLGELWNQFAEGSAATYPGLRMRPDRVRWQYLPRCHLAPGAASAQVPGVWKKTLWAPDIWARAG